MFAFVFVVVVVVVAAFAVDVVDFTIIWTNWPSSFLQANNNNNL